MKLANKRRGIAKVVPAMFLIYAIIVPQTVLGQGNLEGFRSIFSGIRAIDTGNMDIRRVMMRMLPWIAHAKKCLVGNCSKNLRSLSVVRDGENWDRWNTDNVWPSRPEDIPLTDLELLYQKALASDANANLKRAVMRGLRWIQVFRECLGSNKQSAARCVKNKKLISDSNQWDTANERKNYASSLSKVRLSSPSLLIGKAQKADARYPVKEHAVKLLRWIERLHECLIKQTDNLKNCIRAGRDKLPMKKKTVRPKGPIATRAMAKSPVRIIKTADDKAKVVPKVAKKPLWPARRVSRKKVVVIKDEEGDVVRKVVTKRVPAKPVSAATRCKALGGKWVCTRGVPKRCKCKM